MVDNLTPERRSALMSRVRPRDTQPERIVRSALHSLGYRFRVHFGTLLGKPDIVFPGRRKIIFVHGCFWHGHKHCRFARIPKTRPEFWELKIAQNRGRDKRTATSLRQAGWRVIVLWQCQLSNLDVVC